MKSLSRSSSSSSSSTIIGNDIDIFTQILLCLSVKPLLVFKSLSKQWYSVISDPIFIKKHTQRQYPHSVMVETETTNPKFEFVSLDGSSLSVPFETLDFCRDHIIKIKQSCNGLLCCFSYEDYGNCSYYICNPSTKQYHKIVDFGFDMAEEKGFVMPVSVSLAYEPLKTHHYKVICVWMMPPEQSTPRLRACQIEIYSSETDSWKLSGNVFFVSYSITNKSGVYWNGSLHWIDSSKLENHICFNVDQELRTGMPLYRSILYSEKRSSVEYFGECRGRLHLISDYVLESIYDILEMKTDYTGWIKKFRVNVREFPYPVVSSGFCVLHVEEVGESFMLVLRIRDQVISCNLREMSFKDLYKFAPLTWEKISQDSSYQYIETLAFV